MALKRAFKRVGRRVLIDEPVFFECVDENNRETSANRVERPPEFGSRLHYVGKKSLVSHEADSERTSRMERMSTKATAEARGPGQEG
jgi:hypothetical protein